MLYWCSPCIQMSPHSTLKMHAAWSLALWLCLVTAVYSNSDVASQYTGCQSSSQCGPGNCCVLIRGRFGTTACAPLRSVGQECRPPSDTPLNTTLYFPGRVSVAVTGVHESLCPCAAPASCVRGTCLHSNTRSDTI